MFSILLLKNSGFTADANVSKNPSSYLQSTYIANSFYEDRVHNMNVDVSEYAKVESFHLTWRE